MTFLQPIKGKPCARPGTNNKPLHKFRSSKKPLELSEHHNQKLPMNRVAKLASERAVVVFTTSNCNMCHSVTSLFSNLGVNAAVHELDREPRGREMERELARMLGSRVPAVPAVFIGGDLVGGTNRVMALHLTGELVPMLKKAGALWL
jgi:glutaredoxin 3